MEETLRLPYLNQTKPANLHLTNEDAMIDAARAGDLEAFNQLVVRYQDRAYGLAYRIMADEAAAADAAQEAFIAAYKHLDSFRGGLVQKLVVSHRRQRLLRCVALSQTPGRNLTRPVTRRGRVCKPVYYFRRSGLPRYDRSAP